MKIFDQSTTCEEKLDPAELAFLRAVAEGLAIEEAAERYLKPSPGAASRRNSRLVIERARNQARRHGEPSWRLLGWQSTVVATAPVPTLDEFVVQHGLEGWSEAEVLVLHGDLHQTDRLQARRARLRERQLDLLRRLERYALQPPQPTDPIGLWFDPATARRCDAAQLHTLADLRARIAQRRLWWQGLPAIGAGKARRLAERLYSLWPDAEPARSASPENSPPSPLAEHTLLLRTTHTTPAGHGDTVAFGNSAVAAIDAWIAQCARSRHTARAYRRTALVWCRWLMARETSLGTATADHARQYLAERVAGDASHASRGGPVRALNAASVRQERNVLHGFTRWMVEAGHLGSGNCWREVDAGSLATAVAVDGVAVPDMTATAVEPFNTALGAADAAAPFPSPPEPHPGHRTGGADVSASASRLGRAVGCRD